ncbi:hypothetical protein NP493_94g02044 [Ridgeia piscesae]|uniref:Acyl-CoA synthetase short-chain family member 3, mitochondrial n=1 Tax=Ridgeia piscesae TaxID=27915 RepID=A0AAD9P887_RIDPI|nr:hypothetical protein NP493_94g02044 [Ridgeia piscesae]
MPMIPEAVIAMLASARLGALHSLVFGGFASKELATRINHAEPKVIVSANCAIEPGRVINYKPLLDKAIELSDFKVPSCIIYNRDYEKFTPASMVPGRDKCYQDEMASAQPHDCVPVSATDPLYLLYTSGTTGMPKAVVRPSGGHAVVLNWSMYNIYGMHPHETWFAASDLGWVVGHSYIVYAPLFHCNTTVLYEGKPVGTPGPSAYYRIITDHKVAGMFAAPTSIRAVRREDPNGEAGKDFKFPHFRYLFLAGEYCDHETMEYAETHFRVPCLDNWWQTETGSAITSTCVGLGTDLRPPPGVAGRSVPGWNVKVLSSEDKSEAEVETLGHIVVKLPLPPSAFSTLWNNEEGFKKLYFSTFPGYYDTMDAGFRDAQGNIAITARVDDVINVAGHRLSTGQLEEAMLEHGAVAEAAVIPIPDKLKGHVPLGFYVLKAGTFIDEDQLEREIVMAVREHVGPVASFRSAIAIRKLPKTRSGKVARRTMSSMITRTPYSIPVTIEDASVYAHLEEVLRQKGYDPLPPSS